MLRVLRAIDHGIIGWAAEGAVDGNGLVEVIADIFQERQRQEVDGVSPAFAFAGEFMPAEMLGQITHYRQTQTWANADAYHAMPYSMAITEAAPITQMMSASTRLRFRSFSTELFQRHIG